jgi:hypothetical protein
MKLRDPGSAPLSFINRHEMFLVRQTTSIGATLQNFFFKPCFCSENEHLLALASELKDKKLMLYTGK